MNHGMDNGFFSRLSFVLVVGAVAFPLLAGAGDSITWDIGGSAYDSPSNVGDSTYFGATIAVNDRITVADPGGGYTVDIVLDNSAGGSAKTFYFRLDSVSSALKARKQASPNFGNQTLTVAAGVRHVVSVVADERPTFYVTHAVHMPGAGYLPDDPFSGSIVFNAFIFDDATFNLATAISDSVTINVDAAAGLRRIVAPDEFTSSFPDGSSLELFGGGGGGGAWVLHVVSDSALSQSSPYSVSMLGDVYGLGTLAAGESEWFFDIDSPILDDLAESELRIMANEVFVVEGTSTWRRVDVGGAYLTVDVLGGDGVTVNIRDPSIATVGVLLSLTLSEPVTAGSLSIVDNLGNAWATVALTPEESYYSDTLWFSAIAGLELSVQVSGVNVSRGVFNLEIPDGGVIFSRLAPPFKPVVTNGMFGVWDVWLDSEGEFDSSELEIVYDDVEEFVSDPSDPVPSAVTDEAELVGDRELSDPLVKVTNVDLERYTSKFIDPSGKVREENVVVSTYVDSNGVSRKTVIRSNDEGTTVTTADGSTAAGLELVHALAGGGGGGGVVETGTARGQAASAGESIAEGARAGENAIASDAGVSGLDGGGLGPLSSIPSGNSSFWELTVPGIGPGGGDEVFSLDITASAYAWLPALFKHLVTVAVTVGFMLWVWRQIQAYQVEITQVVQLKVPNITVLGNSVSMVVWPVIAVFITASLVALPTLVSSFAAIISPEALGALISGAIDSAGGNVIAVEAVAMVENFIPLTHILVTLGNVVGFMLARSLIFRYHSSILRSLPSN